MTLAHAPLKRPSVRARWKFRLGHWVIRVVSRALTGGYPSRNISLDGWVTRYTQIIHTKKVQVPLNAVSIPSRIHLDRYPDNPSIDYPDVSIPAPKSVEIDAL